jgi:hypothetical protein
MTKEQIEAAALDKLNDVVITTYQIVNEGNDMDVTLDSREKQSSNVNIGTER